ncbi:hypothetical protein [Tropicimonas sp. S265A]|uniref:hypothetical protein n=1 Tax=Tropicimonas sp. S265A TaxID=3415134 RepID=UPI003C7E7811
MFRRIYRQRRRILTCATLFTLTALLTSQGGPNGLSHLPTWVFPTSLAIFFSCAAACVALIVVLFPALRSLCEVVGLFTLAEALLIWAAPELNAALDDTALRLSLAAGTIGLIYLSLYGRLLDRVPALFSFGARSQVDIAAHANQVWNAVVPQQASKSHFWGGKHYDVLPDAHDRDTVHLRRATAPGQYETQAVTFVERDRPYRCRYYFMGEDATVAEDLSEGIYDFKITTKQGCTQLDMSLYRTGTRLREMLQMWFDDALGVQVDALKTRLEGASGNGDILALLTGRKTA